MASLDSLGTETGPDAFGVKRLPVKFEQLPRIVKGAEALARMVIDGYRRLGRKPPEPDKLKEIMLELQKRVPTSNLGMSSTGVVNPTRPVGPGSRFTGIKTPNDSASHMRVSKGDEFAFEKRDPGKLQRFMESGSETPGVVIGTRGKELLTPDQTTIMTQFPQNMIYGGMSVPPSLTVKLQKAIDAFTKQTGKAPTQDEMRLLIKRVAEAPQSTLDLLSFPKPKAARTVSKMAEEMQEGGALLEIAREAAKRAKVRGTEGTDAAFRAMLKREAENPKRGLDYLTQGDPKTLKALEEAMNKKKIQEEIQRILKN